MKEISMHLKKVPEGYYSSLSENIYCLSPGKVYMLSQITTSTTAFKDCATSGAVLKYLFRLPTKNHTYEALIPQSLFEGILRDIPFTNDEYHSQKVCEYLFGKDTVRVFIEDNAIVAIGPEENKEWQYEFQKYHI